MSFFWQKKPATVSLTDLLSNPTYVEDYKKAEEKVSASIGVSPQMEKIERSCGRVTQMMVECLSKSTQSDPKCVLLHHAFLICAGKELVPSLQSSYLACASKNKQNPERCDAAFNEMWTGVNRSVTAINTELTKDVLTEQDEDLILDCNGFRTAEGSVEPWLQCVVPKRCPKGLFCVLSFFCSEKQVFRIGVVCVVFEFKWRK
jgi:hypothetical protein